MDLSCPLGISRFIPAKAKFFGAIFWPYNKSFIDQACLVKMAGYWPRPFFAFLWNETKAKKELGQYPTILSSRLVNNAYILLLKLARVRIFFRRTPLKVRRIFNLRNNSRTRCLYGIVRLAFASCRKMCD